MPSAKEKVRLARPRARVAPDATRRDAFDAFVCTPRAFEYILKSPRPTPPSTQTCTICFVDGAVCDGILCAETHYTCGECFEAYVMSESGKSLGELKKREGRILCPFNTDAMKGADRCNATCFADKDIAKNVSNDAFAAYLRAREKIREEAMAEEMRKEMEQRVELERQRAGNAAEASERLRGAREHVVEKILTLSCPRCTQAFVDFEGCFALNCSRCRAAFCAYCLADCGKDAHAHVGSCPEGAASLKAMKSKEKAAGGGGGGGGGARGLAGQGTTYGTRAMFDESQKRRRCKHLVLYLERHDGETQSKILEGVKTELADLGITSRELRHWQKKEDKAIAEREKKQQQANLAAAAFFDPIQARSIHWSPYDPVRVVNADP
ncbi:uncharacterized protein MICPUCDRAFT_68871 [Micromonas pusilla CCMP1545]|uniref:Predicted protein n=1 Tax=Micromonas pusilla (strain CCMP1545) TaxID=564608 RepID=C1MYC9_MICPC|nr:uncharacterized protein MICPUCDRAFT_68871 [Micromonas pusilla CCMP1545]EEH55031.1 predicted protein [Micromonas pusilla CCMP1545]|eukprot:XP_003060262.1 predicted protein [Micromonas pusilla CCMP1545]